MEPSGADQPEESAITVPDRLRARRDQLLAVRMISIPTSTVRRFFEIDGIRKANVLAFNLFICVVPLTIMLFAALSSVRRNISIGQVFVEQFHLRGETARISRSMFAPNNRIIRVSSFIVVVSFAISGFDVASILEKTFAQAWRVKPLGTWRGPVRGGIWFTLCFSVFGLSQAMQHLPSGRGPVLYVATVPIMLAGNYLFWLVTPRLLLDKRLDHSALQPGAVLGAVASTGLWVASALILPGWFDWYGRGFGAIGIAMAILAWTYVVTITWVFTICAAATWWEHSAPVDEVLATEDAVTEDAVSEDTISGAAGRSPAVPSPPR